MGNGLTSPWKPHAKVPVVVDICMRDFGGRSAAVARGLNRGADRSYRPGGRVLLAQRKDCELVAEDVQTSRCLQKTNEEARTGRLRTDEQLRRLP